MMRRALVLLFVALASTGYAWTVTSAPPWTVYTTHFSANGYSFSYYIEFYGGTYYPRASTLVNPGCSASMLAFAGGDASTYKYFNLSDVNALMDARWAEWQAAYVECTGEDPWAPPPQEPPDLPSDGWSCEDAPTLGASYCYRENEEDYDVAWVTACGGTYNATGLTYAEWQDTLDAFLTAMDAVCDDPIGEILPDDPSVACTGTDGIACESTLQDIRHLLSLILQEQQEATELPSEQPTAEDELYIPPFDESGPTFDEWVPPDVDDGVLGDVLDRISVAWGDLQTTASTRYPFGMAGMLPGVTVGAAPACTDFAWTLLGVSEGLGWCTSAPYTFLTGPGRAALLFLVTFSFIFAVVRTVSFA